MTSVTTKDIIERIHGILVDGHFVKDCEILGNSTELVHNILHEEMLIKKLCLRLVLKLLSVDDFNIVLGLFSSNLKDFFSCRPVIVE